MSRRHPVTFGKQYLRTFSRQSEMGNGFSHGRTAQEWSGATPFERVSWAMASIPPDDKRFASPLFHKHMKLQKATATTPSSSKVAFSVTNDPYWSNASGNMHGGAQATIYDICTSLALVPIAREGFWMFGGVSRTLGVTYLRPAVVGGDLLVECEVVHAGQRLAFIRAEMRRADDGVLISTCEHNKVNTDVVESKM